MRPRVGAVGVLRDVSGRGRGTARLDTNMIIVDKPLFRTPKSNADHAESMRRRVGAVGVLCDVSRRGRGTARPDFFVFIVDKLLFCGPESNPAHA